MPGGIGVGEEDLAAEAAGDVFVVGELGAVVGGDGEYGVGEGKQEAHDDASQGAGVLALGAFCHECFFCQALDEGDDDAASARADDGVHLPVAEASALGHDGGALVDGDAVFDGWAFGDVASSVFEVVGQEGPEVSSVGLVLPDELVDALYADAVSALSEHLASHAVGRASQPSDGGDDLVLHLRGEAHGLAAFFASVVGEHLRVLVVVAAVGGGVDGEFAVDGGLAYADGSGDLGFCLFLSEQDENRVPLLAGKMGIMFHVRAKVRHFADSAGGKFPRHFFLPVCGLLVSLQAERDFHGGVLTESLFSAWRMPSFIFRG